MEYRLFTIVRYNYRDYNKIVDKPTPVQLWLWGVEIREKTESRMLISQHPCSYGVSARVRKSNAGQGQARQTKSNREKQIRD